ncbi:MAG TPA: hypothetical protein DDZ84_06010 [Firmicutes bacterium]|nr:hypothetical protein [Bacillota bacterium]
MRRSLLLIVVASLAVAVAWGSVAHASQSPLEVSGGVLAIMYYSPDCAPALSVEYDGFQLLLGQQIGQSGQLQLIAGLGSPRWGPGRTGSLIMSGRTPPMPLAGYRFAAGNARYVRFVGLMESEQRRRLIGHRLEYSPTQWLRLGVSETAVVAGDASSALYWPFPGLPLYALQRAVSQDDRLQDSLVNVNFGADLAIVLPPCGQRPQLEVYGELIVDDAQGSISSRGFVPDFIGGLVGVRIPQFPADPRLGANLEYAAISNYVYSHRNSDCNYVYRGTGIGHRLGPDADMLALAADFRPNSRTIVSLLGAFERHGEGEIGDPWSSDEGTGRRFLTGIVEKSATLTFEAKKTLSGPAFWAGRLEFATAFNHGHIQGRTYRSWRVGAGIGIRL